MDGRTLFGTSRFRCSFCGYKTSFSTTTCSNPACGRRIRPEEWRYQLASSLSPGPPCHVARHRICLEGFDDEKAARSSAKYLTKKQREAMKQNPVEALRWVAEPMMDYPLGPRSREEPDGSSWHLPEVEGETRKFEIDELAETGLGRLLEWEY